MVWQYDKANPMNPRGLLVAYEEDSVKPVASDLDSFCLGTKNMDFEPLPPDQVSQGYGRFSHTRGRLAY